MQCTDFLMQEPALCVRPESILLGIPKSSRQAKMLIGHSRNFGGRTKSERLSCKAQHALCSPGPAAQPDVKQRHPAILLDRILSTQTKPLRYRGIQTIAAFPRSVASQITAEESLSQMQCGSFELHGGSENCAHIYPHHHTYVLQGLVTLGRG